MEKKTFEQFKDQVAKENGFSDWIDLIYQSDGKEILRFTNVAVELYADQEKKALALSYIEPSEEEINNAWSDWYKENGGNNTQESWESAIAWYKQQINRK